MADRKAVPKSRKPGRKRDPIELQMEIALDPGYFVSDRACYSLVRALEEVAAEVGKLTGTDPVRAVALYETFLAGCYEKVEELDDSSGSFGQFIDDLIRGWIKAMQASGADPDETAARLLARMDDDPYGFCYQIEKEAAQVFDKAGLAAFERQVRERFEAAGTAKAVPGKPAGHQPEYLRRRYSDVLRTLYLAQKNVAAYIALTEQTGLTAQDCHALAKLSVSRRKPEEALAWAERGLALDRENPHGMTRAGFELTRIHRELLTKLGRGNEAIEAAWAEFREEPDKYGYADLMKLVPRTERTAWHEKAMDAAKGGELDSQIHLFLEAKELKRLADLVRGATDQDLKLTTHYATEPAAKKLEKPHPGLAARLWRAQGMRIVDAAKSRYYDAALENFERARRCYERAGLASEWEDTVRELRASHHRKTGFLSRFEALAAGPGRSQPGFLERAKTRWGGRPGRDDS
jgi:tetratricopeptide (TPR) repeat protein